MRNRPREITETVLSKQINRRTVKRHKYKDNIALIEFGFTDHVLNLETRKFRSNLEDDGC